MSARPRSSSAKQTLRSSRGFNDRSNRAPPRRVGRAETRDLAEPRSEAPAPAAAQAEVQHAQTEPPCHREICSICLEGLDDHSFSYPCGQGHRLHYGCMLHFLANVLSLPLADGSPGPLLKEKARDLGSGFKAIAVLEGEVGSLSSWSQFDCNDKPAKPPGYPNIFVRDKEVAANLVWPPTIPRLEYTVYVCWLLVSIFRARSPSSDDTRNSRPPCLSTLPMPVARRASALPGRGCLATAQLSTTYGGEAFWKIDPCLAGGETREKFVVRDAVNELEQLRFFKTDVFFPNA